MADYIDVKLLACKARTKQSLTEEMGVEEDDLTWESVVAWSDARPDGDQPRRSSLTYENTGFAPGELVLVPYGASWTMLGVVSGSARDSHPIAGVNYKKPMLSFGVLR